MIKMCKKYIEHALIVKSTAFFGFFLSSFWVVCYIKSGIEKSVVWLCIEPVRHFKVTSYHCYQSQRGRSAKGFCYGKMAKTLTAFKG